MTWDVSTAYAADHTYFDGVEELTYYPQNPSPEDNATLAGRPVSGVHALRYPSSKGMVSGGDLGIEDTDLVFVFWDTDMNSKTPKNGDYLTDSDDVWYTILTIRKRGYEPKWEAFCRTQT